MSGDVKKVIVVTDGDRTARRVLERVAGNVGGRCISLSAGNPTEEPGANIFEAVRRAEGNPVLVMVDDGGKLGMGEGERILAALTREPGIEVIGAIAVAAHADRVDGVPVRHSVDRNGRVVPGAVNKEGERVESDRIHGDTVDVLNKLEIPVIVGLGDLGKMGEADSLETGARVTTRAVREIMRRAGCETSG